MFESRRMLLLVTVVLTAVFAGASWWAGGFQGDGLALEVVLIVANTLPLLLSDGTRSWWCWCSRWRIRRF